VACPSQVIVITSAFLPAGWEIITRYG
jgi:hypothetical protein